MKPSAFDYAKPRTLDEALTMLARHGADAKLVAGGQSLIPAMNMRLAVPDVLIDIGGLAELGGISMKGGMLRIGAGVRQRDIEISADVARYAPLLAKAVSFVAHAAIRNRGTIGGNLAHADPASELPACMMALGARMTIVGSGGARTVAAESFFRGIYETDLKPGEILTSIEVPVLAAGRRVWFDELARRRGDYAMVGLATVADKFLADARFVFFAVADRPVLAGATAKAVAGKSGEVAVKAGQEALVHDLNPAGDLHTSGPAKLHMARVLLGRAIDELTK